MGFWDSAVKGYGIGTHIMEGRERRRGQKLDNEIKEARLEALKQALKQASWAFKRRMMMDPQLREFFAKIFGVSADEIERIVTAEEQDQAPPYSYPGAPSGQPSPANRSRLYPAPGQHPSVPATTPSQEVMPWRYGGGAEPHPHPRDRVMFPPQHPSFPTFPGATPPFVPSPASGGSSPLSDPPYTFGGFGERRGPGLYDVTPPFPTWS